MSPCHPHDTLLNHFTSTQVSLLYWMMVWAPGSGMVEGSSNDRCKCQSCSPEDLIDFLRLFPLSHIHPFIHLPMHVSMHSSIHLFIYPFRSSSLRYISVCLHCYIFIHPSIHASIHASIHPLILSSIHSHLYV